MKSYYEPQFQSADKKDFSEMSTIEKIVAAQQGAELNSKDYEDRQQQILQKYGDNFDPIPWEEFFDQKETFQGTPLYQAGDQGRVFICMHGAGHSAMSYAVLADKLKRDNHTVVAFDFRGHGHHEMTDADDFSLSTLTKDAVSIVEHICSKFPGRSILLVGHSMGASVCMEVAHWIKSNKLAIEEQLHGFINLDLVEKTALGMLPKMDMILSKIPGEFNSLQEAIQYRLQGQVQNKIAARVSVPSELKQVQLQDGRTVFQWQLELQKTKPFWQEWFKGFFDKICTIKLPCCVILADKDYHENQSIMCLARNATNQNFLDCKNHGHFIHQDQPLKLALFFSSFIELNKIPIDCNEELTITSMSGEVIKIKRNR